MIGNHSENIFDVRDVEMVEIKLVVRGQLFDGGR